jgi:uncharacterized protein
MTNQSSESGHKGGQQSHQGGAHDSKDKSGAARSGGQQEQADRSSEQQHGGSGSFKDDPEKAREAGRKGGQHSQGGK